MMVLAALAAMAIETPRKFDLICIGSLKTTRYSHGIKEAITPWTHRISINLDNGQWCWERCVKGLKIYQQESLYIDLSFRPEMADKSTEVTSIDRQTGNFASLSAHPEQKLWFETSATCKLADYTEIPAAAPSLMF